MKKTKFDFYKPWRKDDLPADIREKMENEHGLEPGATYVGGVDGDVVVEVPQCPYCGVGSADEHRCKHVVFCYDSTNGEYIDVNPPFKEYVTKEISDLAKKPVKAVSDSLEEALTDIKDGEFPRPRVLEGVIEGFSFRETFDVWGIHGIGFGYAREQLLGKLAGRKILSSKK